MNFFILYSTIRHLKFKQIVYQILYRLKRPQYKKYELGHSKTAINNICLFPFKYKSLCAEGFKFLNIQDCFTDWNDISHGPLWTYNLNYMDWLNQKGLSVEEGIQWIDRFIAELHENRVGLDPYPIALRGMNWIKFIVRNRAEIPQEKLHNWLDSLYSQYRLLEKKLEYHLLGNHLLEDAYSLYFASVFFRDARMFRKASKLLKSELDEQILPDGAHYEQSPMYHCILLDRLLDCYNISLNNDAFDNQQTMTDYLRQKAVLMLGHLSSIVWSDGKIPLLNDSAEKIAPSPEEIFDYAASLSLEWKAIPLNDCGYRKLFAKDMEALVDIGNITATYQPGHTHADLFNYEVRIRNRRFIADTGISTYNKTERRQYERSSRAHNTIVVDNTDCYQVWGGFRVGRRVKAEIMKDEENNVCAQYVLVGKKIRRSFYADDSSLKIVDDVCASAEKCQSYIHLADGVEIQGSDNKRIVTSEAIIELSGVESVRVEKDYISTEYNVLKPSVCLVLTPVRLADNTISMSYIIKPDKH